MTIYGRVAARTSTIYAIGMMGVLPFGLVSSPSPRATSALADFGRRATLFAVSSLVTVLCGLGLLQGTMMAVYRIADGGEDSGGDVVAEAEGEPAVTSRERCRLLGSGFIIVGAAAGALVCGVLALFANPVAHLLLGSGGSRIPCC